MSGVITAVLLTRTETMTADYHWLSLSVIILSQRNCYFLPPHLKQYLTIFHHWPHVNKQLEPKPNFIGFVGPISQHFSLLSSKLTISYILAVFSCILTFYATLLLYCSFFFLTSSIVEDSVRRWYRIIQQMFALHFRSCQMLASFWMHEHTRGLQQMPPQLHCWLLACRVCQRG